MLALLAEISLRHWARSPLRTLLVVLGIALGVALYVSTEAASASMRAAFGEVVKRVSGRADLTVEGAGPGIPTEHVATIAETPGVAHAAAGLEIGAQAPELGESLLVLGVDLLGDLHFLPFAVTEGEQRAIEDPLAFVNDPTAILVAQRFAKRHGLGKDSRLVLLTAEGPKEFRVRGLLDDSGPAASFGGQVAVMFIDAAQVSFARGTFADRIDVSLAEGADAPAVQERLRAALGPGFSVERPARLGERLRSLTAPLYVALWLSGFIALVVGGFLVYNAVGVAVAQRRREIGVLRALGVTRGRVVALFCLEAALLSVPGVAAGLFLGRLLARTSTSKTLDAMNRIYVSVAAVEPALTPRLVAQGIAAGLLLAVIAAWWPARRGAQVDPAIVLRGSASTERGRLPIPALAGVGAALLALGWAPLLRGTLAGGAAGIACTVLGGALLAPGVVLLARRALLPLVERALGVPGRLGLDYVAATLGRSTVNVLALMVAVSMSVSVGGWLSSFERSLGVWFEQLAASDLTVTSGSPLLDRRHVPLADAALEKISGVAGVTRVQPYRIVDQEVLGRPLRLVATDTEAFFAGAVERGKSWLLVEGAPLEARSLTEAPRALVGENAARLLGLHAGDRLKLRTPQGDREVEVRGIVVDYTSEKGAVFVDRRLYLEWYGDPGVDSVAVYAAKGADLEAISAEIRRSVGGGGSLFVTRTEALRDQLLGSLGETFSYSRAVELVTLLIALMGVIGTMVAAVLDRARELGMLRAIGATTRQVGAAIVVEAGFLGLCAVLAGLALGVLLCLLFLETLLVADTGWRLDFVFPWASSARIGGLVVATAALAGLLPALRAARADVKSAVVVD